MALASTEAVNANAQGARSAAARRQFCACLPRRRSRPPKSAQGAVAAIAKAAEIAAGRLASWRPALLRRGRKFGADGAGRRARTAGHIRNFARSRHRADRRRPSGACRSGRRPRRRCRSGRRRIVAAHGSAKAIASSRSRPAARRPTRSRRSRKPPARRGNDRHRQQCGHAAGDCAPMSASCLRRRRK